MAARVANVKGIKFLEEPRGPGKGGVALVTFDVLGAAVTTGADTITLGGTGGYDSGVSSTDTLAAMIQKRRRDGLTVTLTGVLAGGVCPGMQTQSGVATELHVQAAAVSTANIASITLNTAPTGGSGVTANNAAWDQPATIAVGYVAS